MKRILLSVSAVFALGLFDSARANILVEYPTSGDCAVCDNILMTSGDSGPVIFGTLNQNSLNAQVRFSSSTDTLLATASGQADIDPTEPLNNLVITIPGYTFTEILFNLNAIQGQAGSTSVITFATGPDDTETLTINTGDLGSGVNRVRFYTEGGEVIQSVTINSQEGLDSVLQVRVGGLALDQGEPGSVPEPSTMAVMGGGLVALAFIGRRRAKK